MHAVCTCLHLSTLVCTLYALVCPPSLQTSAPNCTTVIPPTQFGIGEADFWLERPKDLPPVIVLTAPHRHYVMLLGQRKIEEELACKQVQVSADKCKRVQTSADSRADKKRSCLHYVTD